MSITNKLLQSLAEFTARTGATNITIKMSTKVHYALVEELKSNGVLIFENHEKISKFAGCLVEIEDTEQAEPVVI